MKSSMSEIEPADADDGPVVSEGGRSPSTLSTGHCGAGQGPLAPGQRWSVGRKREVVLRLLRGKSVSSSRGNSACLSTSWSNGGRRPPPPWTAR